MSTRFYDNPGNDDTVRLLSNPLNSETLETDEFESTEDGKISGGTPFCSYCSLSLREINSIPIGCIDNDHPISPASPWLGISVKGCKLHLETQWETFQIEVSHKRLFKKPRKQTAISPASGDCHHCHQALPIHLHPQSKLKLSLALCLCLVFMVAEMVGGYIAGSVAVVSDAAHLLMDVIGFLISLIAISTSKKKSTKGFNLGFYRIEVLATLTSIMLIWIMTGIFMYIAATRLIAGVYDIEVNTMIIISSLGVLINVAMFSVLHGNCHPKHIHSHHMPPKETSKVGQNINVRAAVIHVIGDMVQSIGVFISSILIKFYPSAKFMDPVCTFIFSIVVICSTLKLLKDSVNILMEGFPWNVDYNNILISLQGLSGVRHVHSLCVWSLTLDKNVLLVHLAVDDTVDRDVILCQAQRLVSTKFGIHSHTIQIEKYHPKCMHTCQSCRPLWG